MIWKNIAYDSIASYKNGSGDDSAALALTPNLRVQAASVAVDAGINLGSIIFGTCDFAGKDRVEGGQIGIGAYEQYRDLKRGVLGVEPRALTWRGTRASMRS